ncbi:hypothetical protein OG21DRAFT_1511421 [Imleria badia]|nr:hypothetical protein OG21DRAFT_1511421 [Imleria badia]
MTSPLDPPSLPTSPRTLKAQRRTDSLCIVPSTERHGQRTRSMSQSLSTITTSERSDIALASPSVVANKRRQSSIAYYTPASPSPWTQRPQSNTTAPSSVDGPRDGEPVVVNGNMSKRSSLVLSSRSPSTRESVSSLDGAVAREREPLTLVEKHADLLRFIAHKERKCLELRDQLALHEKELAELKRKWERIVNRGHDPLPNPPPTAGIGGAALDGLKEGVRMIAAGFSDLGGVIHELEGDNDPSKPNPLTHAPRTDSEHLSMSSMSSIQESASASDHVLDGGEGETTTVATAPSLARAGSLNCRMHKRASRVIAKEPTTSPTSVSPAQSPKSTNLDVGMSLVLAPSPTLVPPFSGAVSTFATPATGSTHGPVLVTAGSTSSWMDNMGKKLNSLQNGQTFSKGQKRASSLLAGVSSTISAALLPGPTATTPAPIPMSRSTSTTSSISTKSSSLNTRLPPLSPPRQPHPEPTSHAYPSYKSMTDWLDEEEEEQTVHAGGVLLPDATRPPPRVPGSSTALRTTDVTVSRGEAPPVSSFDNDDWNW